MMESGVERVKMMAWVEGVPVPEWWATSDAPVVGSELEAAMKIVAGDGLVHGNPLRSFQPRHNGSSAQC